MPESSEWSVEENVGRECPTCVAIVICNEVIEDKWTNNKSLIGLFNSVSAQQLPAHHPRMFVMVSLTDGRGDWKVVIEISDPSGNKVFEAVGQMRFDDPIAVHDLVVEVQGLPLPEEGEYYVGLTCGGRFLASRRFTVVKAAGGNPSRN